MNLLELDLVGKSGVGSLSFNVRRVVNAGYVGRNQDAVRQHIEELQREGVAPPPAVPMLFPLSCATLTTADRIETIEEETSGEVEFVLLVHDARIYVGIGSDHTDRRLERTDLIKSKQACPNVLGRSVWDYEDVRRHWDQLQIQSWVRSSATGPWTPYQSATADTILSASDIVELVRQRLCDRALDGMVIFSGTVPTLGGKVTYGAGFRCALVDPILQRSLDCAYEVRQLDYLKSPESVAAVL